MVCNSDNEMTCSVEPYHYKECGLDNIILLDIEIYKCVCGEEYVSIPAMPELHGIIGLFLIKQKSLLTGKDIRFLRKNMGLNSKTFAEYIGTSGETVSRWENGKYTITKPHDRLIRFMYLSMKEISPDEAKQVVENDFVGISEEFNTIIPPHQIPRKEWDKTNLTC